VGRAFPPVFGTGVALPIPGLTHFFSWGRGPARCFARVPGRVPGESRKGRADWGAGAGAEGGGLTASGLGSGSGGPGGMFQHKSAKKQKNFFFFSHRGSMGGIPSLLISGTSRPGGEGDGSVGSRGAAGTGFFSGRKRGRGGRGAGGGGGGTGRAPHTIHVFGDGCVKTGAWLKAGLAGGARKVVQSGSSGNDPLIGPGFRGPEDGRHLRGFWGVGGGHSLGPSGPAGGLFSFLPEWARESSRDVKGSARRHAVV